MAKVLVACAVWIMLLCPGWAEQRVALVIGNAAYERIGPLVNPTNDAFDISVALEGLGFDVLSGTNLSQDQMRDLVADFGKRAETADVVLFYYAGHGFQVGGENYLVPVDAFFKGVEDLESQTVHVPEILSAMERSQGVKLVFLDACRDNPFGEIPDTLPDAGTGLARVGTAADFLFAYATQPDNVAYDGIGRNSFFTEAMLSHIYTPGQSVAEFMIAVRRDVLAATGGRQVPWENSSLTRQFRFDQSPPTASEETLLWQVVASEQDESLMQLYLDRFPQGAHAPDVQKLLQTGASRSFGSIDADAEAERLWTLARRSRMRPLLEYYLKTYPSGAHKEEAERLLNLLPFVEQSSPDRLCERLATHPRDATAVNSGVSFDRLRQNALPAIQACSAAAAQAPDLPHYTALLARATAAAGELDRAVALYQKAAKDGDLRAMVSLAQLTETGNGVPKDVDAAMALYERAAEGGSEDAMINLAVTLFEGALVERDEDRAIALLQRAAEFGSAKALFNLGVLAQDGVIDSPEDALEYFGQAARDGEANGYRAAAILLDEGRGVPSNPTFAADMLLRGVAGDSGTTLAQLVAAPREWSKDTIAALQTRLKAAGLYEAAIDGLAGQNFETALRRWRNGGFDPDVLAY